MSSESQNQPQPTALESAPDNPPAFFGTPPDLARVHLENSVAEASRRFGFASQEGDTPAGGTAADSEDEADVLKRLLADQRAATLQAQADALNLQKALAEAQERLTKTKGQIGVIPVRLEDSNGRLRPDAVLIKAQWERAKKDLQRSQAARTRDAEQAKARLAEVTDALQLAEQATAHEKLNAKRQSRSRMLSGMGVFAVVLGLVLFAARYWNQPKWAGDSAIAARESRVEHSAPARPSVEQQTLAPDQGSPEPPSAAAGNSEVTQEISRLTHALDRFPGVDPEVVLRAVNKKAPSTGTTPCAFEWNHGEPALQFGDRAGGHTTIAASVSRCATAVEQYR